MRFFILGLIALNVMYYYGPSSVGVEEKVVSKGDRGVPLLSLLSEAEVLVESRGAASSVMDKVDGSRSQPDYAGGSSATLCYTTGPFRREETAELATRELIRNGIKVDWRAAKESRTKGYAVFLPSYPSVEAARQVIATLSAGGLDDHFIFSDAKKRNAISLGFFTLKSGSEKRVAKLKVMGFSPLVEARFDEVPVFWLDYQLGNTKLATELWKSYGLPSNVDILARQCK